MGDPELRAQRSKARKRNILARDLWQNKQFKKKIHMSKKDRDKQREWRLKNDPEGDYNELDDWLTHTENF